MIKRIRDQCTYLENREMYKEENESIYIPRAGAEIGIGMCATYKMQKYYILYINTDI